MNKSFLNNSDVHGDDKGLVRGEAKHCSIC